MKHEVASYNTRRLLSLTLKTIMRSKEFSDITISEVAKAANLNRKTFYYHFKDLNDLLAWTLEDEAVGLVTKFNLKTDHKVAIHFILDYLEANEEFVDKILNSYARSQVHEFLYRAMREQLLGVIEKICEDESIELDYEYKKFVAGLSTEAFVGMMIHWRDNTERIPRKNLEEYFSRVFNVSIINLLEEGKKK